MPVEGRDCWPRPAHERTVRVWDPETGILVSLILVYSSVTSGRLSATSLPLVPRSGCSRFDRRAMTELQNSCRYRSMRATHDINRDAKSGQSRVAKACGETGAVVAGRAYSHRRTVIL